MWLLHRKVLTYTFAKGKYVYPLRKVLSPEGALSGRCPLRKVLTYTFANGKCVYLHLINTHLPKSYVFTCTSSCTWIILDMLRKLIKIKIINSKFSLIYQGKSLSLLLRSFLVQNICWISVYFWLKVRKFIISSI